MNEQLHRRVRQMRGRLATRSWEYRQRHHAAGVWHRLRRTLVDAAEAYRVSPGELDELLAEGLSLVPVGLELHPPKRMVFVGAERLERLESAERVPVRLGAQILEATDLVLVSFRQTVGT